MSRKFKVGDRVIVNGSYDGKFFNEDTGTVIDIGAKTCSIEFDRNIHGHSQWGLGKVGYCWRVPFDMVKPLFKVGDKVRIRQWDDMATEFGLGSLDSINCKCCFTNGMKPLCGEIATISEIYGDEGNLITLNFNTKSKDTRWNYSIDMIEPCDEEKIVIYRTGNKVVAKDTITGKECYSRCHPDDEFDFNIGAKLAFDRLVGNVEPKPKYYNGKVVCVDLCGCNHGDYTVGKVYDIVDGVLINDRGHFIGSGWYIKSFEDFCDFSCSKFIEVVE